MFSRMLPSNRKASWVTIAICSSSDSRWIRRRSTPSIAIEPAARFVEAHQQVGDRRFARAGPPDQRDDLRPPRRRSLMWSRTGSRPYENDTSRSDMRSWTPSMRTASGGSSGSPGASRIAQKRSADACESTSMHPRSGQPSDRPVRGRQHHSECSEIARGDAETAAQDHHDA